MILGTVAELDLDRPWQRAGPVFGDLRLAPYRLGQRSFQAVVLDAYHRRCAITGTHIPPVLQAAHIRPVTAGVSTGWTTACCSAPTCTPCSIAGTSAWTPRYRLLVSPRLRADFSNGDQFYAHAGQPIELPDRRADRPGRDFLDWHLEEVFKAS
jgi:putative restriction endonuclease